MENKNTPRTSSAWRACTKGWQYDGDIDDPVYLKERSEFFYNKENERAPYNGWWWFRSLDNWKDNKIKLREKRAKKR